MSILAQAAGILELESERRLANSATAHNSNDSHRESMADNLRSVNVDTRTGEGEGVEREDEDDADRRASNSLDHHGYYHHHHNINPSNRSSASTAAAATAAVHLGGGGSRSSAYVCNVVDHGSTPPGSASPPPDSSAPGGAGVAAGIGEGGAVGFGGGGGGGGATSGVWNSHPSPATDAGGSAFGASRYSSGRGRVGGSTDSQDPSVAMGFAVARGDTVTVSTHHGSASYPPLYHQGEDQQHRPRYDGHGYGEDLDGHGVGLRNGGGGDSGGADDGLQYGVEGEVGAPPGWSNEARSSRPGWYSGPGGAYQRGLGSVPGPWRPYWKGRDGFAMGKEEA